MGRGKFDTCKNCTNASENRDGTYRCKLDKSDNEPDFWCKHHKNFTPNKYNSDCCENCTNARDNRDGTYRCRLDKSDNEPDNWCKHHKGEDEK